MVGSRLSDSTTRKPS